MKIGGGHFAPKLGGHFELESGGHFKLELGGQYHWNLHLIINEYILRFNIKENKINFITSQKFEGADISNLIIWVNN